MKQLLKNKNFWIYTIIGALVASTLIFYRRSTLPAGKPTKEAVQVSVKQVSDRKLELITLLTEASYNALTRNGHTLNAFQVAFMAQQWNSFTEAQLEEFVKQIDTVDFDAIAQGVTPQN